MVDFDAITWRALLCAQAEVVDIHTRCKSEYLAILRNMLGAVPDTFGMQGPLPDLRITIDDSWINVMKKWRRLLAFVVRKVPPQLASIFTVHFCGTRHHKGKWRSLKKKLTRDGRWQATTTRGWLQAVF